MGVVIHTQIAAIDAELARRPDSGPAQAGGRDLPLAVRVAAGGLIHSRQIKPKPGPVRQARERAAKGPGSASDAPIKTADSFRALFPVSPHDRLRCPARHRRATRPGRDRAWAVQKERERVPLGGGERGCRLGQFPDPGVQTAAGLVCAVPVGIVTLVALSPVVQGADARPGCRPGSGLPLRR
jgi:hypothetical protein